jgi:hypothetical protein
MVTINITKPPIPLIWLDTWMFNAFGRMRAGILPPTEEPLFRSLFDVLLELRDQGAILCPETGQFVEIHPVGWSIEEAKSALSMLSGGVKTYHQRIVDTQMYRAMQSYARGADLVEVNYKDAFDRDPIRELAERDLLVRVDLEPPSDQLAETRAANLRMASAMEALRKERIASKTTLAQQIEIELGGERYAAVELMKQVLVPMSRGEEPESIEALMKYAHMVGRPARMLGELLEETAGKRDDYNALLAFFNSDHYRSLPATRVRSELFARKMIGTEPIKASDVMDMNQISAFLPLASYIVLDKSMARKVEQAGLHDRYGVRLFTRRTIPTLVTELEALAARSVATVPSPGIA